jgi:carbamoyl-phosphate synthase large subunit
MTLRVAVTGVSGDVGRGAIIGLRRNPAAAEPIHLLGLDADSNMAGADLLDDFRQMPRITEPGYIETLIAVLRARNIDVLLPGIDAEIAVLSAARERLAAVPTRFVLAPPELVAAADDKLATTAYLMAHGIAGAPTQAADEPLHIDLPLVAKPRRGNASKGVATLASSEQLAAFLATRPVDYCLQRYIEGPEITAGLIYDGDGALCDALAMDRGLDNGRTVWAKVRNDGETMRFLEDFGKKVRGIGAINLQLRWSERDGPMIFEINARLSGSTEMRVALGFNDPLRLAFHFGRGLPIARARPRMATIRRSGPRLMVEPC